MPPAMMMGVTDEKKRACVMLVFSMPSTQKQKCSARAPPDSSISMPLWCVRCLSSAAAPHAVSCVRKKEERQKEREKRASAACVVTVTIRLYNGS